MYAMSRGKMFVVELFKVLLCGSTEEELFMCKVIVSSHSISTTFFVHDTTATKLLKSAPSLHPPLCLVVILLSLEDRRRRG